MSSPRSRPFQPNSHSTRPLERLEPRVLMAAWDMDPSFGVNATGSLTETMGSGTIDQLAYTVAVQGDNKVVVGGRTANAQGQLLATVMRFRPDGALDNTFGGDGKTSIVIRQTIPNDRGDMAILRNGRVVLVTSAIGFSVGNPDDMITRFTLVLFNSDGTANDTFHTNGIVQPTFDAPYQHVVARAVSLLPDGRVLVAGHTIGSSDPAIVLARFTVDGVLDESFGDDGLLVIPFPNKQVEVQDMVIDRNGRAIIVGSQNGEFLAARFTAAGAFDTSFNGDGLAVQSFGPNHDEARAVAIQSDGLIVVGGAAFNEDRSRSSFVGIRLDDDGFLDRTFDGDGIITGSAGRKTIINSVAIEPDGQIAFAGEAASTNRAADVRPIIMHFNPDGSRDNEFGDNGDGILRFDTGSSTINSITTRADGKLHVAGARSNGIQDLWFVARAGRGPFEDGTDGNLYVTGDDAANEIVMRPDGTRVRFLIDDAYATTRARSTFDRVKIWGRGGDDTIRLETHGRLAVDGGAGNDTVHGSAGSEHISGGSGNDVLFGNEGDDRLLDGAGDDRVHGGPGEDRITIGSGNDFVSGGGEADDISASGAGGAKFINGEGGNDTIRGGEDDDVLIGSGGRDRLYGRGGDDRLIGGDREDFLDGGPNDDVLSGEDGDDNLLGGSGRDKLFGGVGADFVLGSSGDDAFFDADGFPDTLGGGSGTDIAFRDELLDELSSIETAV